MSGLAGSRDITICNPRGAKLHLHDIIWHPEGRPSILTTILTWPLGPFILIHLFWFNPRQLVEHSIYCLLLDCILSVVGFIQSPIAPLIFHLSQPACLVSLHYLVYWGLTVAGQIPHRYVIQCRTKPAPFESGKHSKYSLVYSIPLSSSGRKQQLSEARRRLWKFSVRGIIEDFSHPKE